jgi:hypothetical protein
VRIVHKVGDTKLRRDCPGARRHVRGKADRLSLQARSAEPPKHRTRISAAISADLRTPTPGSSHNRKLTRNGDLGSCTVRADCAPVVRNVAGHAHHYRLCTCRRPSGQSGYFPQWDFWLDLPANATYILGIKPRMTRASQRPREMGTLRNDGEACSHDWVAKNQSTRFPDSVANCVKSSRALRTSGIAPAVPSGWKSKIKSLLGS